MRPDEPRRMLVPQYSLRWLLGIALVCCVVVFPVFALAVREYDDGYQKGCWATGVSIAVVSLLVVLVVHALVFALLWLFSVVFSPLSRMPAGTGWSPFVDDATSPRLEGHLPSADRESAPRHDRATSDKDIPATPILLEPPEDPDPADRGP